MSAKFNVVVRYHEGHPSLMYPSGYHHDSQWYFGPRNPRDINLVITPPTEGAFPEATYCPKNWFVV